MAPYQNVPPGDDIDNSLPRNIALVDNQCKAYRFLEDTSGMGKMSQMISKDRENTYPMPFVTRRVIQFTLFSPTTFSPHELPTYLLSR